MAFRFVIVRFFNTVGPRQLGEYGMVIPIFVHKALMGDTLPVFGDGNQRRSFTYVIDVVKDHPRRPIWHLSFRKVESTQG